MEGRRAAAVMSSQSLSHPSHQHELYYASRPPYPSGAFSCNACRERGNDRCFRCDRCNFDLHVQCTKLPDQVNLPNHLHPLILSFSIPYSTGAFCCNVCRGVGSRSQWLYRCPMCNFDAHLRCATDSNHHQHRSPMPTMQQPTSVSNPCIATHLSQHHHHQQQQQQQHNGTARGGSFVNTICEIATEAMVEQVVSMGIGQILDLVFN